MALRFIAFMAGASSAAAAFFIAFIDHAMKFHGLNSFSTSKVLGDRALGVHSIAVSKKALHMSLACNEQRAFSALGDITSLHDLEEFLTLAKFRSDHLMLHLMNHVFRELRDLVVVFTFSLNSFFHDAEEWWNSLLNFLFHRELDLESSDQCLLEVDRPMRFH